MILEYDDFDLELVEHYCFKLHRTTIESEMDIPCPITESQDIYELMNNNDIEESVKNFFYYSDYNFSKELQDYFFEKYPFNKDKNINILPFSLRLFGAFFNRSYIFSLLMNCSDGVNGKRLIIDDKEINSFSELAPYLLNYAKGFKYGYENFINEYVCQNLIIDDKNERIEKIFDFVTNKNIFNQITGYNNHKKFYNNILLLGNAEIEGKFFGFVYKAWSLIFSNFKNYKNLFNDYLQPSNKRILNQKINNGIDIIDVLIIQLDAIIKLFKKDIDANETKFIYYIHEKDVSFLDDKLLKQYLAKTKIENLIFLKIILDKIDLIIKYYKVDLESLPVKEFEFEQIFKTRRLNYELRTYQDFYILILCNDKAVTINNESLKINFFKETNYKEYSHVSIYSQCKILRELLLTAYPQINISDKSTSKVNKDVINNISADYTKSIDKIWFKVGIKFANGTIFNLLEKHNNNISIVQREINISNSKVYISKSINDLEGGNNTDKNIFINDNKVIDIIEYCKDNQITIDDRFKNRLTFRQKKYLL